MEKFGAGFRRFFASSLFAAALAGCQTLEQPDLSRDQIAQLTSYVAAYHFCVAHTAARMDDGQSAITEIAGRALDHCKPEADIVSTFLSAIKLPEDTKTKYINELLGTAARQSAIMLRRRRAPSWDGVEI